MNVRIAAVAVTLVALLSSLGGAAQAAPPAGAPQENAVQVSTADAEPGRVAARGCFDWHSAVAGYFGWSRAYPSTCAVFGRPGLRVGYAWAVPLFSNGRVCVQARGYKLIDGVRKARWFGMGCGTSGSGTVPWGNVAATPAVRGKVQLGFLGGAFSWRH
jgi:hypothetical protein